MSRPTQVSRGTLAMREIAAALGLEDVLSLRLDFPVEGLITAEATIAVSNEKLSRVVHLARRYRLVARGIGHDEPPGPARSGEAPGDVAGNAGGG